MPTVDLDGSDLHVICGRWAVSASDDYPDLATFTEVLNLRDGRKALIEIDMLRSDVAKLLTMCAKAGAQWGEAAEQLLVEARVDNENDV
jgi:hypothetical protein